MIKPLNPGLFVGLPDHVQSVHLINRWSKGAFACMLQEAGYGVRGFVECAFIYEHGPNDRGIEWMEAALQHLDWGPDIVIVKRRRGTTRGQRGRGLRDPCALLSLLGLFPLMPRPSRLRGRMERQQPPL